MSRIVPPLLDMMRTLIAQPSVSSARPALDMSNVAVLTHLQSWLDDLGFRTELQALTDDPAKANLIATLGSGPGGLVLAGHTDTVPWDEGRWQVDPFAGQIRDERLYGLGSADMKSFLAMAVEAAGRFADTPLREPLIILATADEECSMMGARHLAAQGRPRARAAVVGEPTGLRPVRMHKGIMMERIVLRGLSGHSSNPALGRNALDGMHRVMGALMQLREDFAQRYREPAFSVPQPTLNLGHIHGGDNPNRICAECELHFDLRLLPGMEIDEMRALLARTAHEAVAGSGLEVEYMPLFDGVAAMSTPAGSALVAAVEKLTGFSAGAVDFGTEGPFYRSMGMDTVILGPGSIDQAHQPDEFLELAQVEPTVSLLESLIHRFCADPGSAPATQEKPEA